MAKQLNKILTDEDRIAKMRKLRPKQGGPFGVSFRQFDSQMRMAVQVPHLANNITKPMRHLLYRNAIVNFVTLFEGWVKQLIIDNKGHWSQDGVNRLMNTEIRLSDAYKLFGTSKVSPESVITHSVYSFSNYRHIFFVIDTLTDGKKSTIEGDEPTNLERKLLAHTIDLSPEPDKIPHTQNISFSLWLAWFKKLYHIRNQIVHEPSDKIDLQYKDVVTYSTGALFVAVNIIDYIQTWREAELKRVTGLTL